MTTADDEIAVRVKLTDIRYDMVDDEGVDHSDDVDPGSVPLEITLTVTVPASLADDEETLTDAALDEVETDWLIESCGLEILEDEVAA